MGFGELLFDRFTEVCDRTEEGLETLRVQSKLLKKLAKVEEEYGRSLGKLAKEIHKESFGKKLLEKGTNRDALVAYLNELENIGNHHVNASNTLSNVIAEPLNAYIKVKEKQRKQIVAEGARLQKDLETAVGNLAKLRKSCHSRGEAAEKATQQAEQAQQTGNPKADKLRVTADGEAAKAEALDREYADLVQQTNALQSDHYNTLFPRVLDDLEALDHERIEQFRTCLDQAVNAYLELAPAVAATAELQKHACSTIDSASDVTLFINESISGASYPGEIPYEPAPFVVARGSSSSVSSRGPAPGAGRAAARPVSGSSSKRGSSVPAAAKKDIASMSADELQERITQIDGEIEAAIKTSKGIATLIECYPDGSDAKRQVQSQIADCNAKVRDLHTEKNALEVAAGLDPTPLEGDGAGPSGGAGASGGGGGGGGDDSATALYDYAAQGDGELSFAEGDVFTIAHRDDDSGWYECIDAQGNRGVVPSNYLSMN